MLTASSDIIWIRGPCDWIDLLNRIIDRLIWLCLLLSIVDNVLFSLFNSILIILPRVRYRLQWLWQFLTILPKLFHSFLTIFRYAFLMTFSVVFYLLFYLIFHLLFYLLLIISLRWNQPRRAKMTGTGFDGLCWRYAYPDSPALNPLVTHIELYCM